MRLEALEPTGKGDSPCGKSVSFFLMAIRGPSRVGNRGDMIKYSVSEDYSSSSLKKGLRGGEIEGRESSKKTA